MVGKLDFQQPLLGTVTVRIVGPSLFTIQGMDGRPQRMAQFKGMPKGD